MNRGLEKDKSKAQKTFKPKQIDELSITVYSSESGQKKFTKAVNWIKRYVVKPTFDASKKEEAKQAMAWANGPYQKIEIMPNRGWSKEKIDYFHQLMKSFSENKTISQEQFTKTAKPVRIKVTNPEGEKTAWTCLNEKNTAHGKKGKLLNQIEFDYELMWDFQTLLAETKLVNELYRFTIDEKSLIQEKVVQYCYSVQLNKEYLIVPEEVNFQKEFIEAAKRCLSVSVYKVDARMERFRTYFEIKYLKSSLVLGWTMTPFLESFEHVHMQKKKSAKQKKSAKVYQTNQNIKANVLEVMKDNAFLTHYGEVELHNDIDLEKFKLLEKDFLRLKEFIAIPVCKDYAFRIKKLGNHRAGGLHYEGIKNVIVDVSNPQAYVHELGHQIDSVYGKKKSLSSTDAFKPILIQYRELVERKVDYLNTYHSFRKQWFGKGKYNHEYYLEKREVFARCFEIYADSLAPKTLLATENLSGIIYPKDEQFVEELVHYFNTILL